MLTMDTRTNVSQFARARIDEYSDINDKNRVCTRCGFEKTVPHNSFYNFCNTCNSKYEIIVYKESNCCTFTQCSKQCIIS